MVNIIVKILWGFSLLIFTSIFVSPKVFWFAGLLSLMIPLVLILNTGLFFYLLFKRSKYLFYPLSLMVIGLLFLNRTVAVHGPLTEKGSLSVLSYNVRVFNVYSHLNNGFISSKKTIDWASNREEDVKCFQEFYVQPGSGIFSTIKAIRKKNPYYHFEPKVTNREGAQFGMAIFSKYPIVQRGSMNVSQRSLNSILFADLDLGMDTVRIYNIHLESMSIDENRITNSNTETISRNLGVLLAQLKLGFTRRAEQIDDLCEHVKRSPHPVILTGDLNDIPYSYSYQKLKKYLYSSFENGGSGFGFTFNGKLFFLRIDNQFYSDGIILKNFKTHRAVNFTDHYPLTAEYSLGFN